MEPLPAFKSTLQEFHPIERTVKKADDVLQDLGQLKKEMHDILQVKKEMPTPLKLLNVGESGPLKVWVFSLETESLPHFLQKRVVRHLKGGVQLP